MALRGQIDWSRDEWTSEAEAIETTWPSDASDGVELGAGATHVRVAVAGSGATYAIALYEETTGWVVCEAGLTTPTVDGATRPQLTLVELMKAHTRIAVIPTAGSLSACFIRNY